MNNNEQILGKLILFNQEIGIIRYAGPVADDSGLFFFVRVTSIIIRLGNLKKINKKFGMALNGKILLEENTMVKIKKMN